MNCLQCGKPISNKRYGGLCQGCYNYFKGGGKIHDIPAAGTIVYDDQGKVICHICGKSFVRLGSHVKESHGLTIAEYKERFGLCHSARTTEKSYSDIMRRHAKENGMDQQLLESGKSTRIQKGDTHLRKGKKVRLQEIINSNLSKRKNNK